MMNREAFLSELDEIKAAKTLSDDPASICNRLYTVLVDCLAYESKNVEAKLEVLASVLDYYIYLRLGSQDRASPETDAFGHFLFMECSHVVLGMEFHHLSSTDVHKATFKLAINEVHRRLASYSIGQVFMVLEWLMVNQWSNPTLVTMMKGEDIDEERALMYISSGEYPELFRLRVQMLMESGCDNYACNLVSWCLKSPVFDSDVPLRATQLLLLHKLCRYEQLYSQCCLMHCCTSKEVLKYMISRSEEPSFLLLISQTLLLLNWIKPGEFCCTKELLEFWLTLQHRGEPDSVKFIESINKVVVLTQDVKKIVIFLDGFINLFHDKFLHYCSELALAYLRKERPSIESTTEQLYEGNADAAQEVHREGDAVELPSTNCIAKICQLLAQLYQQYPQMHIACLLSVFYLESNDEHFHIVESAYNALSRSLPTEPLPPSPDVIDQQIYSHLLETVDSLRPPEFNRSLDWKLSLKPAAVLRLESAKQRRQLMSIPSVTAELAPGSTADIQDTTCRLGKLAKISAYLKNSAPSSLVECGDVKMSMPLDGHDNVTSETDHFVECDRRMSILNSHTDGAKWSNGLSEALSGESESSSSSVQRIGSTISTGSSSLGHAASMTNGYPCRNFYEPIQNLIQSSRKTTIQPTLTLDDIQQVLRDASAHNACDGESEEEEEGKMMLGGLCVPGRDIAVDEKALSEITAFLQSELLGRQASRLAPDDSVTDGNIGTSRDSVNSFKGSIDEDGETASMQKEVSAYPNLVGNSQPISTIMVTDTNLAYLQQFLPNLQTVMQSVQSFVISRASPQIPPTTATMASLQRPDGQAQHLNHNGGLAGWLRANNGGGQFVNESGDIANRNEDVREYSDSTCLTQDDFETLCNMGAVQQSNYNNGKTLLRSTEVEIKRMCDRQSKMFVPIGGPNLVRDSLVGSERMMENTRVVGSTIDGALKIACKLCEFQFTHADEIQTHICKQNEPAASDCETFKCDACERTFASRNGRATHMIRAHNLRHAGGAKKKRASRRNDVKGLSGETPKPPDNDSLNPASKNEKEYYLASKLMKTETNGPTVVADMKNVGTGLSYDGCFTVHSNKFLLQSSPPSNMSTSSSSQGMQGQSEVGSVQHQMNFSNDRKLIDNVSSLCGSYRSWPPKDTFSAASPKPATANPLHFCQGPVMEMLEIANHFLRNNATLNNGSSSQSSIVLPRTPSNGLDDCGVGPFVLPLGCTMRSTHTSLPPPPPYAAAIAAFRSSASAPEDLTLPLVQSEIIVPAGCGKEILYEGTKMLEFVEFQCDRCLLTFSTGSETARHVESSDHVEASVASYHMYHCIDCNIKYRDKRVMRNHCLYLCTAAAKNSSSDGDGTPIESTPVIPDGRLHSCSVCFKTFISELYLIAHEKLKHSQNDSITDGSSSSGTIVNIQNQNTLRPNQETSVSTFPDNMSPSFLPQRTITPQFDYTTNFINESDSPSAYDSSSLSNAQIVGSSQQQTSCGIPSAHGSRKSYPGPLPAPLVSIPTLEQLTSSLGRVTPSTFQELLASSSSSTICSTDIPPLPFSLHDSSIPSRTPNNAQFQDHIVENQTNLANESVTSSGIDAPVGGKSVSLAPARSAKAKGIYYKNVLMHCEGTYFCSVCKQDLSSRDSKKSHRLLSCGDPKTVTYSRRYTYLCPYCRERFSSQKDCRKHQIAECLRLIGVDATELKNAREMVCPLCPKKYFNLIPLKGHMTQVHKLPKSETRTILDRLGYVDEIFDRRLQPTPSSSSSSSTAIDLNSFSSTATNTGSKQKQNSGDKNCVQAAGLDGDDQEFNVNTMMFEFDNDASSELAAHARDMLGHASIYENCPPDTDAVTLKDNASVSISTANEQHSDACAASTTDSASFYGADTSFEQFEGSDIGSPVKTSRSTEPGDLNKLIVTATSSSSPKKRVRKKSSSRPNDFFPMVFRNYPILAKGVSVCLTCHAQLSGVAEIEAHIANCSVSGGNTPAGMKRSTLFKCTHCDRTFWKAKACRQHQIESCLGAVNSDSLEPSVACPLCSTKSYNRSGLMSHMKYRHSMDTNGVRDAMIRYGIEKSSAVLCKGTDVRTAEDDGVVHPMQPAVDSQFAKTLSVLENFPD